MTAGYTVLNAEELREPAQLIENHIMQLAGIYKPEISIKEKLFAALNGLSEHQQLAMLEKIIIEAG